MSKNMKKKMLKKVYDDIFKNRKDPMAANLFLLVLEVENYYKRRGFKTSFANLKSSGAELDNFMIRNKGALQGLFMERFSDPSAYLFTGNFQNKSLDLILNNMDVSNKLRSSFSGENNEN